MTEIPIVIVGDADAVRQAKLQDVMSLFNVETHSTGTFEELMILARRFRARMKILAIAADLRHSDRVEKFSLEGHLQQANRVRSGAQLWVIASGELPQMTEAAPSVTPVWPLGDREEVFRKLQDVLWRFRRLPSVELQSSDEILREQILGLNEDRDLEAAKKVVAELALQFVDWSVVKVGRLTQGLSGAQVFKISSDSKEYALKLIRKSYGSGEDWKLRAEADIPDEIPGNIFPYKTHMPRLVSPKYGRNSPAKVASTEGWAAICYDFLGGSTMGPTLDLYTALTEPVSDAQRGAQTTEEFRHACLQNVISWLRENWYKNVQREKLAVWDRSDAEKYRYPTYPPYRLSARNKALTLGFLASDDARLLGPRLILDWVDHKERIWRFLSNDDPLDPTKPTPWHQERLVVTLGPAHGDFNARNVILWEKDLKHPFFIDFPMFQKCGHALQDFARMELEIKAQLMDQQTDTPSGDLQALSWTWNQMALWQEMEAHLLSPAWEEPFAASVGGYRENVNLAYSLIRQLRTVARGLQEDGKGPDCPPFWIEYRLPLLFHTLRIIGYSVPLFKRLFSVFSASAILKQLQTDA